MDISDGHITFQMIITSPVLRAFLQNLSPEVDLSVLADLDIAELPKILKEYEVSNKFINSK
jgi:hypothetical protein